MEHDELPEGERSPSDSTAALLTRIRAGDRRAIEQLVGRHLPALRHWAHARLPVAARSLGDTDDLVQETIVRALRRLESFEIRPNSNGFPAYLRRIFVNLIRDEIRKASVHPTRHELDDGHRDPAPTPLETLIGQDSLTRYERALSRLPESQRAAVILRLEMGLSYAEVGESLGSRSAEAARSLVVRAVQRLAQELEP